MFQTVLDTECVVGKGYPGGSAVKNLPATQEMWVQSLGWEDFLEVQMATCSSILARSYLTDRGVWQAIIHGVAKSCTKLK